MNENSEHIIMSIYRICKEHQEEYSSGRWYITQTGINKVCKILGGDYKNLTTKQRNLLRQDCVNEAQGGPGTVKPWLYYINI